MRLLAFDASTEALSVALHDSAAAGLDREIFDIAPREHAHRLLPAAHTLLDEAGLSLAALDGFAFARGPGAFTGLRIAAGLVQGLSLATGLPVVGISTLAVLARRAFDHAPQAGTAQIVQDARMGEIYTATFHRTDWPNAATEERVLAPADLTLSTMPDVVRAGNGWALVPKVGASEVPQALLYPHALDVARCAVPRFATADRIAPSSAVPVYVRDDVARKPGQR
ncbi:tRNA (adenosine(37)-N6)-threonylcarbamoyltransferase complex dimerization subunit type 1 TsaB [Salinisphaera sp. Q1T1-3]|uniref:tRNA (adenosine(37)-N6)-threonylcarbamoyltransferase complex dimerization subunit type 1 TsaB n=1 Tax=Salinisphaera sp. Q1T1-3 TaxID=2321229 RepID=UPI001314D542|nr:tRNA (adenosine(37)-N6)-threonylcarbamoyltransferase complex dimerization subunit type 1 TsaB [Salinisphaera sp. Q1T1-3]